MFLAGIGEYGKCEAPVISDVAAAPGASLPVPDGNAVKAGKMSKRKSIAERFLTLQSRDRLVGGLEPEAALNGISLRISGSICQKPTREERVEHGEPGFDRIVAVNVRAIFAAVQEASKHMGEGGRIVNIGSMVADRTGFPGAAFYGMTKAAVASMTRGFAIDLAPRGITVNNIQPGPTGTDMNPADGPSADMLRSMIPLKRYGTADEVAGFVAYLASSESGFVTGASLTIDGGLTI